MIRFISSEDCGYASGDAHPVFKNLAAISEDELEEEARLGLNGLKGGSTGDLVISFSFFTFGRLCSKPASSKSRATITDHVAFDAWDEDWTEAVERDGIEWIGVDCYKTPVKLLRSSTWWN